MSRKKVIIGVSVGLFLISPLIANNLHRKTYDEHFNKDIKRILSLKNINRTIIYLSQNPNEDLVDNLPDNIDRLIMEKFKDIEMKRVKEEEIHKEITVAENTEIIDNSNSILETSVPERNVNQSTPNRGTVGSNKRENNEIPKGYLNEYVLNVIKNYPIGSGKYPYLLDNDYENYNGVTENLYYKGELLLKAHPSSIKYSHCSGITFEVFFKAMRKRNEELGRSLDDFNGLTKDELYDFILTWYVANGNKSESNLAVALEKYGLGERITNLEELRSGDFIDFSRENNTGHSVVFISWIKERDRIIGFKYWSSQESTNGIGYNEEYLNIEDKNGNKYGNVIINSLHMARVK